jgi:hypothetical protein
MFVISAVEPSGKTSTTDNNALIGKSTQAIG